MIKHIVMWKIVEHHEQVSKLELLQEMKAKLETLPEQIVEIIDFNVDINIISSPAHFDIALSSTFATLDDLQAYQIHPKHVEVAQFIQSIAIDRAVIDSELNTEKTQV